MARMAGIKVISALFALSVLGNVATGQWLRAKPSLAKLFKGFALVEEIMETHDIMLVI